MKHRAPVLNAAILVLVFAVAVAAQSTEIEQLRLAAEQQLRLAAEQGYASAQLSLGFMYADGRGVLKDDAKAVKWFRLAAEQGDARSQSNLGLMYVDGRGVLKDDAKLRAGTGWPPSRETPKPKPTSGSCTPRERACRRTMPRP